MHVWPVHTTKLVLSRARKFERVTPHVDLCNSEKPVVDSLALCFEGTVHMRS